MKLVSIISVNYNQAAVTEAMLASLTQINTYTNYEVIVVDNASKDNPIPRWVKEYPEYTFIRCEENLGFAGGNNVGIAQAQGDYLFLINNDTELTATVIQELVDVMEANPNIGMISPRIHYHHDKNLIQYVGFTPMNFYVCRNKCVGYQEPDRGQYNHLQPGTTAYIHGAAMMVSATALQKVGPMAENFFLYYEEVDWCERFKRQHYEIWLHPQALIYHKESAAVGQQSLLKEYFMNRNRILFIRRNAWFYQTWIFTIYFLLIVTPRNLISYIAKGRFDLIKGLILALWWNLTNNRNSTYVYIPK